MEKHVAQIFDRKQRIIEQALQECHLWEHHVFSKLILSGILPPPWLCNSALHSLPSDPKELNQDDTVSGTRQLQTQFEVPFQGHHRSLHGNEDVVSGDDQYPVALQKDCVTGDGHSILPDCSVNNAGCASSGPPELDCGAISPRNQVEPRVSESYHDPAMSLAKLQRSKSRQKALELRTSAKAYKCLSGDETNAGGCAAAVTGPASSTLQEHHIKELGLDNDFHPDIQSCSMEEVRKVDSLTQKDQTSNNSVHITRSKSLSQKFNNLNVSSSFVEKEGPSLNDLNEASELVNRPYFISGNCVGQEENVVDFHGKETGSSVYDKKRLTKLRSSGRAGHSSELRNRESTSSSELKNRESTSGKDKEVEASYLKQPCSRVELTSLSSAYACNSGSRRNTVKDGDCCQTVQESNIQCRLRLHRSSCPSPGDDFLKTGDSVKCTAKPVPQPLISNNLQDPAVPVVGSFGSEKDPDICSEKTEERFSRSGSGKVYLTRNSMFSKSLDSKSLEQISTCSESVGKKSQTLQPTGLDAGGLSSSPNYSILDRETSVISAEKGNIAALAVSRNSGAVASCTNEESLRPISSSNLDDVSLLAETVYIKAAGGVKVLDVQENTNSGANPTDDADHRSAATVAKDQVDFDGLAKKDPSCLGSRLTIVNPKIGKDVSVSKLPADFGMSVMPKQLFFDDVEKTCMNGISSPDLKEGRQGMTTAKESLDLLEPLKLPDDEIQEVLVREEDSQINNCASRFMEGDTAREVLNTMPPNKELPIVRKELCILTSSLMNSSLSQVGPENSSIFFSKEVMSSQVASTNSKPENHESSKMLTYSFSDAVTGNGLHKYTEESVANFMVGFPYDAPTVEVNVDLAQNASNTISLTQNSDLSMQALPCDSTDIQNLKSSTECFTYDVEHSRPQHKRRKIEMETEKFLPDSTHLLENSPDSTDQRPATGTLGIGGDNPAAVLEVQHLPYQQEDDIGHERINNSPTDVVQERRNTEGSLHEVTKVEKVMLDGRGRSSDTCTLAEANSFSFCVDSTMNCTVDEKVESCHLPVNSGIDCVELLVYGERSTSSRKTDPRENAEFSDGLPISPRIRYLDIIGTDEALPEFEGFIMQTDNAQSCTTGDEMDLENMNLPSNSVDYTSLGKSRLLRSSFCYSSTPRKVDSLTNLCQSLPNGLLEGYGLRASLPLNNGSPRAFSDCLPNCKGQYTSSVQTLWDRINSNYGSSGKRKSLKSELPCINEENENVDEVPGTFQNGVDSDEMTGSITQGPLTEILNNANPSTSVLQDDEDLVGTESSFGGSHKNVDKKLGKQDGYRSRFTSKGKENQSISLGPNGAKRTSGSVRKRSSRPKLSGKDSLKQRPTFSGVKSTRNNIVSNVTSFIPLVQQKQAAAAFTGKRDIKVKALEAAEATKRMAEKIENERKMKREALRIERLELQKKKKEEGRKKEAEMAAKKRHREDEEKKEKERKRKRVNDVKQQQQEHKKMHARKEEIEAQHRATGEKVHESRKFMDERDNHNNLQLQDNIAGNGENISETEPLTTRDSANDKAKATVDLIKAIEDDNLIIKNLLQEQSYEISPYKGSDDEDEDEDGVPNNKFIPSWASKHRLSMIVSSQKMDPETIFPRQSFCNIAEVLLPRKLQL